MLKSVAAILVTLVVAFGGGAASVWYALDTIEGLGALKVGAWTAHPQAGTAAADPYSMARAARRPSLPLGQSEGIVFTARGDASGTPLDRRCTYRLEGVSPVARVFTLHARDVSGDPLHTRSGRAPGLSSFDLLRLDGGLLSIEIGPQPAPGNWLATGGDGPMSLVLTLYDTPVASNERIGEIVLPRIVRTRCPS